MSVKYFSPIGYNTMNFSIPHIGPLLHFPHDSSRVNKQTKAKVANVEPPPTTVSQKRKADSVSIRVNSYLCANIYF